MREKSAIEMADVAKELEQKFIPLVSERSEERLLRGRFIFWQAFNVSRC